MIVSEHYELMRDFFKLPEGQSFGLVSRVAAEAQGAKAPFFGAGVAIVPRPTLVFVRDP